MSGVTGPNLVTDGLQLYIDAGNVKSYSGSGTVWSDLSGNGHDVTLVNSPTFSSNNGGYFDFNGSSHKAYSTNVINLMANDWTIDCWVYLDDWEYPSSACGDNRAVIWGCFNGYWNGAALEIVETSLRFAEFHASSAYTIDNISGGSLSTWMHVTVAWDDDGYVRSYVNGVEGASRDVSSYSISPNAYLWLNYYAQHCGFAYVNGRVSGYRVYTKCLTVAEILQNYNAHKSRYGL